MHTPEKPPEESQYLRHHTERRRHHSSRRQLVVMLSLALVVETVLLIAAYVRMSLAEGEKVALEISERKQAEELEILRPKVQKLQDEITAMTQSRLPGLDRLELDKVIAVDRDYVKNVVFTTAGKGDSLQYEYKMTTRNATLNLVHPQVDILFFDHLGIQVGVARIGVHKDGTSTLDMLERGETRSYAEKIQLNDDVRPEYFRLRIYK